MATEKTQINFKKIICEKCNYITSNKYDYERHIGTRKHLKCVFSTTGNQKTQEHICQKCNKIFSDRSGLWKHKNKNKCCNENNDVVGSNAIELKSEVIHKIIIENIDDLKNETKQQQLIEYLVKENVEFKQLMIEQNNKLIELTNKIGNVNNNTINTTNTTNNNTTNNNNNFNLHVFLNTTCKNAMNIDEFVNQLPVGINDLEETGRLGFAEGISKIFINGLNRIEINDRPLHCTDSKRDVIYIKSKNEWNKETNEKPILLKAIKQIAHKNIGQIQEWTKLYPEYNDSSSRQSDKYLKIVSEAMSGGTVEECEKNYNKIMRNITKQSVIDK